MRAVLLDQLATASEQPVRVPSAHDPRLATVCALLETDPSDSRGLEALGRTAGASSRTLTRLYHALRLLAEDRPATTVAQQCGFATARAFIDVFRRSLGHTPVRISRSRRTPPPPGPA